MINEYQKIFIKIVEKVGSSRYSVWEVFNDFCGIAAWNLRRAFYPQEEHRIFEKFAEYDKKYNQKQIDMLSEAFAQVIKSLEVEFHDFLGEVYMEMDLGKKQCGQFFTPQCVCDMMSKIMNPDKPDYTSILNESGYFTVNDCASGSGAMLIGMVKDIVNSKMNPSTTVLMYATDVDLLASQMCYIQFSLCGVAAVVTHGNSLSMETYSEYLTPVWFLNNWKSRFQGQQKIECLRKATTMLSELEQQVEQDEPQLQKIIEVPTKRACGQQLTFDFDLAHAG